MVYGNSIDLRIVWYVLFESNIKGREIINHLCFESHLNIIKIKKNILNTICVSSEFRGSIYFEFVKAISKLLFRIHHFSTTIKTRIVIMHSRWNKINHDNIIQNHQPYVLQTILVVSASVRIKRGGCERWIWWLNTER
jgi:hypothetical protein